MRIRRGFPQGVLIRLGVLAAEAVLVKLLVSFPWKDEHNFIARTLNALGSVGSRLDGLAAAAYALGMLALILGSMAVAFVLARELAIWTVKEVALPMVWDTLSWAVRSPVLFVRWARGQAEARRHAAAVASLAGGPVEVPPVVSPGEVEMVLESDARKAIDPVLLEHMGWRSPDPNGMAGREEAEFFLDMAFPKELPGKRLAPEMAGLQRVELHRRIRELRRMGLS